MGLDFTSIPDREGVALYMLHTGNTFELQRLTRLEDEITTATDHQVVLIDVNSSDGEQIRSFYSLDLEQLPTLLVIQDDDSIAYQWSGDAIPSSGTDIAYQLNQISGGPAS
jgi:hypothetical protein